MAAKKRAQRAGRGLRASQDKPDTSSTWSPRIIVRFRDDIDIPHDVIDVGQHLDRLGVGLWKELRQQYPQAKMKMRRLFNSVSAERLRELVELAVRRDATYKPPNFLSFCAVEFSPEFQAHAALVPQFASWGPIRSAYVDSPGGDPACNPVNPTDDDYWPNQGYLDPEPDGIDAEYAWTFPGGDGCGQDLIDLERGWTLDHEDLKAHNAQRLYGDLLNQSRYHGTAVLGEICAVDNDRGCVGIAPNLRSVNVVSYFGKTKPGSIIDATRPGAIIAAIDALPFGGVLLIEAHLDHTVGGKTWFAMPIEVLDAEFEAIRLATALGITVVAAAGNGGNDLDTFADKSGKQLLNRSSVWFRDSGAIMVAAASATAPHTPVIVAPPPPDLPFIGTNFGSRIDCYGWGETITTTNSVNASDLAGYTNDFAGTSGAAPIIAGAALVVQGLAEANLGYRFSAWQMRVLLTDPATSTLSATSTLPNNPANDKIGVMPDLKKIIDSDALKIAPDVYIRDFPGDSGNPHADPICVSPDVILLPATVPNPQTAFGEGSGTENSVTLGSQVTAGQDNYLYVRVRNRGGSDATGVTVSVYYSPAATLVTPDLWNPIGQTVIPNLPSGGPLTVSNAIVWPAGAIPGPGHYCFVVIIGNAVDPAPKLSDFLNWANYERFIRDNNNVTWHNFNVVDIEPGGGDDDGSEEEADEGPSDFVALHFIAPGAPDRARYMSLDVMAGLPSGSRLFLEIPRSMTTLMRDRGGLKPGQRRGAAIVALNPYGRRSLGEMLFTAKSRTRLRLLVYIPPDRRDMPYEVSVRQLFQNRSVGRLTWRLAPVRHKPHGRKAAS